MEKQYPALIILGIGLIPLFFLAYQAVTSTPWLVRVADFGEVLILGKDGVPTDAVVKPSLINFVGDVMIGRNIELRLAGRDVSYLFENVELLRDEHSLTIGNFEASVPAVHVPTPSNTFRFSVSSSTLAGLKRSGFTHFSLANNHTFDYGLPGFNSTLSSMADANLVTFGHPSVLSTSSVSIFETKGYKVAVLGVHTLYGDPLDSELDALFEYMRLTSELQIVYVHWGDEYSNQPNQRQRKLAELLVQKGADLIIGHHPHVVQSVAVINSVPVFYSLGNFVFDQYFSKETQHGLILTLNTETNQILIVPTETETTKIQPKLESDSEAAATLHALSLISDVALSTYIKAGVVPLRVATSPDLDIMSI